MAARLLMSMSVLLGVGAHALASRAAPLPHRGDDAQWLTNETHRILQGCQLPGPNGTSLFTPDASHGYGAQWTRDFFYILAGAPAGSLDPAVVLRAVALTFGGQRADGCMPDRVRADGVAVYGPGSGPPAWPDHAWDNGPFAALLLSAAAGAQYGAGGRALFCALEPQARRALDFVNRSGATGLVSNAEGRPNCTYGFTDTVAKSGSLLFTSLLYFDASSRLAALSAALGCGNATRYRAEADEIRASVDAAFFNPSAGLWDAATGSNALPDVWGSAYLVSLNLTSSPQRARAAVAALLAPGGGVLFEGQVRHLPGTTTWARCCWTPGCTGGCPAAGTYQNGAFWATPLAYLGAAMRAVGRAAEVRPLLAQAVASFRRRGIFEAINPAVAYHGVLDYCASATSVLQALRDA